LSESKSLLFNCMLYLPGARGNSKSEGQQSGRRASFLQKLPAPPPPAPPPHPFGLWSGWKEARRSSSRWAKVKAERGASCVFARLCYPGAVAQSHMKPAGERGPGCTKPAGTEEDAVSERHWLPSLLRGP
jgi:hypothetical protein